MARPPKSVKLKIANTEFEIGDILEITPKLDLDAPSGFQQHGTSKLLMSGIAEPFSIMFDEDLQMWDTGFDEIHPINDDLPKTEKKAIVKSYVDHIKTPYEKRFNKNLDSTDDSEFWDTYIIDVYKGRKFDTSNIKDLLDLYLILRNGMACEEREKNYHLKKANYNIANVKQVQSIQEKKEDTIFSAMGTLKVMLDSFDPKKDDSIYTILEWINIPNVRGADKETVKKVILKQFANEKTGYDTCRRFLNAYEMTEDKTKKEIMENFSVLNKLSQKRLIEFKKRQYYINGQLLGNNLKEAAENIKNDKELYSLVEEAFNKVS